MYERDPYSGNLKTLDDLDIQGASVLVRGDLDVKYNASTDGQLRLRALKETVDYLVDHDARRVILLGHVGRPKSNYRSMSTARLVGPLQSTLNRNVNFFRDPKRAPSNKVSVFENLRFNTGETSNDLEFAKELASMGEIYVNDAFGNSHREHASMATLPYLVEQFACGRQVEKEVDALEEVLSRPRDGFISVVGGAKIETKLPVIDRLSGISELVLIGGRMPSEIAEQGLTFPDNVGIARPDEGDIDGASSALFSYLVRNEAKTIIWNGPMGIIRPRELREGVETEVSTRELALSIARSKAFTVVGGGDTTSYLAELEIVDRFSFVSMGGGAMLDFISGKAMPALEALRK